MKALSDDLHVLTGSYALDALSGPERDEFERHLQRCPSCATEVRGLRETATRLAMASSVRPPAAMEQRVLAAAHRTRQLPPLPAGRRDGTLTERVVRYVRAWPAGRGEHRWRSAPDPAAKQRPVPSRSRSRRPAFRLPVPRLAAAVAAVAVVVAGALGATQVVTQHQLHAVQSQNSAIAGILGASDAHTETLRTKVGGTVTVVVSDQQRGAVVSTRGMAALSSGQVYQLWVMAGSAARSAALLSATGRNGAVLASGVRSGDKIGITVEPAGGSTRPTTTPVVVAPA